MEALTMNRAVQLAKEVVAEFGEDYVYPEEHKVLFPGNDEASCMYVHHGKPSCIVGQILHQHGVSTEELSLWENRGAYRVAEAVTDTEDAGVLGFLSAMQSRQDAGMNWGDALIRAREIYGV
jgi:hypothetical protein